MKEILNLKKGETRQIETSRLLGFVVHGKVSVKPSGNYRSIDCYIEGNKKQVLVIWFPTVIECLSPISQIVWFEFHGSSEFERGELTIGQPIRIGLTRISLLELNANQPAKDFEDQGEVEGFIIKGELQIEEFGSPQRPEVYHQGEMFSFNSLESQIRLSFSGREDALVFLVEQLENPLALLQGSTSHFYDKLMEVRGRERAGLKEQD
ncbi:MAG: hypothetical protein HC875_04595 [Anaerolineales bacterium]|nr:hypothetical protein [Anaerolineales bacterium]